MTPLSFYFGGKLKETLSLFLNTGKQMGNAQATQTPSQKSVCDECL